MERLALLIGVSEYRAGIPALPECIADVDAMQRVLVHPKMGGFAAADITVLKNPDKTGSPANSWIHTTIKSDGNQNSLGKSLRNKRFY
jgi:Caspase domain